MSCVAATSVGTENLATQTGWLGPALPSSAMDCTCRSVLGTAVGGLAVAVGLLRVCQLLLAILEISYMI